MVKKTSRTSETTAIPSPELASALQRRLLAYCLRQRLFQPSTCVVVAVSGGADSLCLLHCLHALSTQLRIRLHVTHVHHGLRADEADLDARFVAQLAIELGLPHSIEHIDVRRARLASGESLEAVARRLRYDALRAVAKRAGAECIATGHTRDDQAETVLMNLLRGAGLDGLSAMRPRERDIARPLLGVSRDEVDAYISAHGQPVCVDVTNADHALRRNAIRLQIIPLLEQYNPRIKEALARTATTLGNDADYLRSEALTNLNRLRVEQSISRLELDRRSLAALPAALRLRVLRCAIESLVGSLDGFAMKHFSVLDALLSSRRAGQCGQLPRGVSAEASGDRMLFKTGDHDTDRPPSVGLTVPGEAAFGAWHLSAAEVCGESETPGTGADGRVATSSILVDRTVVRLPMIIRSRMPGDRIQPPGLHGHRKLQDVFVDAKVPRAERDEIPIVTDTCGEIIWVVGHVQAARSVPIGHIANRIRLVASRGVYSGRRC